MGFYFLLNYFLVPVMAQAAAIDGGVGADFNFDQYLLGLKNKGSKIEDSNLSSFSKEASLRSKYNQDLKTSIFYDLADFHEQQKATGFSELELRLTASGISSDDQIFLRDLTHKWLSWKLTTEEKIRIQRLLCRLDFQAMSAQFYPSQNCEVSSLNLSHLQDYFKTGGKLFIDHIEIPNASEVLIHANSQQNLEFFHPKYLPQSFFGTAQDIVNNFEVGKMIFEGDCDSPKINHHVLVNDEDRIFISEQCEYTVFEVKKKMQEKPGFIENNKFLLTGIAVVAGLILGDYLHDKTLVIKKSALSF